MLKAFLYEGILKRKRVMIGFLILFGLLFFLGIIGVAKFAGDSEKTMKYIDVAALYLACVITYYRNRKEEGRRVVLHKSLPLNKREIIRGVFAENVVSSFFYLCISFSVSVFFGMKFGIFPHFEVLFIGFLLICMIEALLLPLEFIKNRNVDAAYQLGWILLCISPGFLKRFFDEMTEIPLHVLVRPDLMTGAGLSFICIFLTASSFAFTSKRYERYVYERDEV